MNASIRISTRFKNPLTAFLWLVFPVVAIASVFVTAEQVAQAIRNSPNASSWLKANAEAVGRLAMFESSGQLDVYNDSCCSGILQMNKTNIQEYAKVSPEVFRTWDLQKQVDAWSKLTTDALQARAPSTLAGMGTFDGREVNGDLVLACVQLGIGNCQKMINSGSCNGFADINGTTICRMADRIQGNADSPGQTGGGTTVGVGGAGSAGGSYKPPADPCIRDGEGCMSMTEAMESGFQSGSGESMRDLRSTIFAGTTALVILIVISLLSGLWRNYANGVIDKAELIVYAQKAALIILTFYVAMSLF